MIYQVHYVTHRRNQANVCITTFHRLTGEQKYLIDADNFILHACLNEYFSSFLQIQAKTGECIAQYLNRLV